MCLRTDHIHGWQQERAIEKLKTTIRLKKTAPGTLHELKP